MNTGSWLAAGARFVALLMLLAAVAVTAAPALQRGLAPWQAAAFHLLHPDFQLTRWETRQGGDLHAEITPRRALVVGEQVRLPDRRARASASMPWVQTLLGPVLLLALALAAPASAPLRALRALAALPLVALGLLLDAPLVLGGLIWQLLHELLAPGQHSAAAAVAVFLQGGGRAALALAGGAAIVLALQRVPSTRYRLMPPAPAQPTPVNSGPTGVSPPR